MSDAPTSRDPAAEFDEFYRLTRDRLLLQTFALTGDLTASRSGVRDAFVVAWHHWPKTARATDPESTVRTTAWRHALRRATARRWRRDQDFDAEANAVLDGLADLSLVQRKVLLLTQLAGTSLQAAAREVALPLEAASRELGTGAADFARVRAIDTAEIPQALASLSSATRTVRWPRSSIITRAGGARRRAHTVAGAVAVAATLVVAGMAVGDSSGVRPTLDRQVERPSNGVVADPQVTLPDTELLPAGPVQTSLGGRGWKERSTKDNSDGDGRVLACQQARYVDPDGEAAWVRTFRDGPRGNDETRRVIQVAEASADQDSARTSYRRLRDWMAGCAPESNEGQNLPQHRLVATFDIEDVGNQAHLFLLRNDQTGVTYATAMARTGRLVTAVSLETAALAMRTNRDAVADLVGSAVQRMCKLPAAGKCAGDAALSEVPPFPAGENPALLSTWDLPPAGRDTGTWVGPPVSALTAESGEIGVVSCSTVGLAGKFKGAGYRHGALRSFVLPEANLPVEFGLTQAVASLPAKRASQFVGDVRGKIAECPDSDAGAGTKVRQLLRRDNGDRSITAWQLRTELPDDQVLTYDIAILRDGTSVSALLFVSVPRAQMRDGNFVGLAERALERLDELPGYQKKR
ncbi:hypothetical protein KUV85_09280 [Nocardioides panacisoli]|uniref:hypothetical protein n=1 Tax=Nocardioides panacisoli TaxID=627624 RepID=UPI001C627D72|nr:hypothetical protein [Nocardioides panacisoli]QYJ02532.1 hypothetical protein KUV85_09280 [Nocardioides panacisoli]